VTAPDENLLQYWEQVIEELLKRGLITYRPNWMSCGFGKGQTLMLKVRLQLMLRKSDRLVKILSGLSLKPLVIATKLARYFERQYLDSSEDLVTCTVPAMTTMV